MKSIIEREVTFENNSDMEVIVTQKIAYVTIDWYKTKKLNGGWKDGGPNTREISIHLINIETMCGQLH